MVQNYPAPDSGNESVPSAGNSQPPYGAPTPHAAAVAHEPYVAPEGDLNQMANTGWEVTTDAHTWTPTPGEAGEMPARYDET